MSKKQNEVLDTLIELEKLNEARNNVVKTKSISPNWMKGIGDEKVCQ